MKSSAGRKSSVSRLLVCALLVAGWTLGVTAQEQESPMLDYVDQKMIDIGAQLQNAKMRLRKNFAGVAPEVPEDAQTPAVTCCMVNLETIHGKLLELREAMTQMLEFYRDQHNTTAVSMLGQMSTRLDQITAGMVQFARAPVEARAFDAMNGLIRPWNEFRNGVSALRSCCPLPIPVPEEVAPDEASTGKKEKERKKDKKE